MKIKIISDGTSAGTKIIDEDSGEEIGSVSKVGWIAEAGEVKTRAVVEIINVPVEITTDADLQINVPVDFSKDNK